MIHYFKFSNFFSFSDEVEIDFRVTENTPDSNLIFMSPSGERLSKVMAVLGPNASGKTNYLKSLSFLMFFATESFSSLDKDNGMPYLPHFFEDNGVTNFELVFENDGTVYKYILSINKEMVLEESLFFKSSASYSYLFKRKWNEENNEYDYKNKNFNVTKRYLSGIRSNCSVISYLHNLDSPKTNKVVDYFHRYTTNITGMGRHVIHDYKIQSIAKQLFEDNDLLDRSKEILFDLDFNIDDISIERVEASNHHLDEYEYQIYSTHSNEEKSVTFPFGFESSGTQSALYTLTYLLCVIRGGGIAIMDELESDLHPHMIPAILKIFINEETNPKNAQIIFTTHSHESLNILEKEQVTLVEKDESGSSDAWRLDLMKGVRRDDNLYAKYTSGAYGAVPNI